EDHRLVVGDGRELGSRRPGGHARQGRRRAAAPPWAWVGPHHRPDQRHGGVRSVVGSTGGPGFGQHSSSAAMIAAISSGGGGARFQVTTKSRRRPSPAERSEAPPADGTASEASQE